MATLVVIITSTISFYATRDDGLEMLVGYGGLALAEETGRRHVMARALVTRDVVYAHMKRMPQSTRSSGILMTYDERYYARRYHTRRRSFITVN